MYEPAVAVPKRLSMLDARAEGAKDASAPVAGAADAGDATNAEPTSMKAARPTIGRRRFRLSTGSSRGVGGTPVPAYRCSRSIDASRYWHKPGRLFRRPRSNQA